MSSIEVTPQTTDDELAAILIAYEALWPPATAVVKPKASPRWHFAGRRWTPRPSYRGWT